MDLEIQICYDIYKILIWDPFVFFHKKVKELSKKSFEALKTNKKIIRN